MEKTGMLKKPCFPWIFFIHDNRMFAERAFYCIKKFLFFFSKMGTELAI